MKKRLFVVFLLVISLVGCTTISRPKTVYTLHSGKDTIFIGETWTDAGMSIKYGVSDLEVSVRSNNIDINVAGTYEVVYEGTYSNKTYTFTRYVFVVDDRAPVMTLNAGVDSIKVNSQWIDAGVSLEQNATVETLGFVDTSQAGEYVITYKAINDLGNMSYLYRIVTVYD